MPKTSSGKVRRRMCAELFQAGRLDVAAAWSLDGAPSRLRSE
jgi:hypothetical protein